MSSYYEALRYGKHSVLVVADRLGILTTQVHTITPIRIGQGRHRVGLSVEGTRKLASGEHPRHDPHCTCAMTEASLFACPKHGLDTDEQ